MLFQPSMHWVVSYGGESTRTLTKMTTRDSLKECTRSRTGRLSLERWRVKFRTMRMEEAPPIRVQVKNVLGASAVRSCAAGGACMTGPGGGLAGHTRSARGDATEAWRAQQEDALQEQGSGLLVRARSVRSCAAEGAGSTYAAGACSSGSPACPTGACLERSPNSCTTRVKLSQLRVFHCSARCVESTCLFRLGGIRD